MVTETQVGSRRILVVGRSARCDAAQHWDANCLPMPMPMAMAMAMPMPMAMAM
jgi:hypothetical protein